MQGSDLRTVLAEQKKEMEDSLKNRRLIDRNGLDDVRPFIGLDVALIITGVRRCGKSTFTHQLLSGSDYIYVNFDDERIMGLGTEDLQSVLEAAYFTYGETDTLLLDEVQNVPGWELFVNRLIRSKKVILTGSSANLLGRELSTHLTGRHIDHVLYPFSFSEYLRFQGVSVDEYLTRSVADVKRHLMDYMGKGGFPEGIRSGERFHRALLNDILNKDISARYRIKFTKELNELALLLLSNISREISYSRLKGPVGIRNVHTVKSYLQYLESSYLFFQISRFSRKLKEQYLAPRKIYCIDTGLVSSIAFSTSRNTGHLMENIVSVELQRRKALDPSMDVFYWKDHRGREVDFVVLRKGEVKELIQVTFDLDQLDIRDRELSALNGAEKELECSRKTIITFDRDGKRGDARMVPLWKWLLGLGDE